ncbi:MAG: hypothetical protein ACTH0Y_05420 [Luteimonas sp.]
MENYAKPPIGSLARLRALHILSLVVFAVVLGLAASAWAQSMKSGSWPTTEWVVMEQMPQDLSPGTNPLFADRYLPSGERGELADKHRKMLEAASIWFQSMGFPAPLQVTRDRDLDVDPGEPYRALLRQDQAPIGSSHNSEGEMMLTSHPDFLPADTPMWGLMKASADHELYHAIQKSMSPRITDAQRRQQNDTNPECRNDTDLDWLSEGTAAMVQIRRLEQTEGVSWGHPFTGSTRAAWVRVFDQPLYRGAIPFQHQVSKDRVRASGIGTEEPSWACDYGTWYFWYAVGDMIARNDREKVAYTRYIFDTPRSFDDDGIDIVDRGLKRAANVYDAIGPYRGGLHDLYPQFVAQYLTEDRFYDKLKTVELGAPDRFFTRDVKSGPLGRLATRAWRFRIHLPDNAPAIPYNVRFTLDAHAGTDRDDLHLIVDDKVIAQHVDPSVPYSTVMSTDRATQSADGVVEYLVRIANVAEAASETEEAHFSLQVEVDGFYGEDVPRYEASSPTASELGAISGELAPGFYVRGPGPWSCNGNDRSRAIFDLVTPDELGRDIERVFPQAEHSLDSMLDEAARMIKKMGGEAGMTLEQLAALRQQAEGQLADGRAQAGDIDARADEARDAQTTELAATFVGLDDRGQMCQVTLGATLAGRQGGAQVMDMAIDQNRYPDGDAPTFDVEVYTAGQLRALQSLQVFPGDPLRGWEICTMTDTERRDARDNAVSNGCPPVTCSAGELRLEQAEQGGIAGLFEFDVIRWPERSGPGCRAPLARDKVVGHFNVSSTDDGFDDNSLGIEAGLKNGMLTQPGAPILDLLP